MSPFEIKLRSSRFPNSLLTPNANAVRGLAFQESDTAGTAELANGLKPFVGFLTRQVKVGGPTMADLGVSYQRILLATHERLAGIDRRFCRAAEAKPAPELPASERHLTKQREFCLCAAK